MTDLLVKTEFWNAVASLAWPIAFMVVFFRLRPFIESIFKKSNMTIKFAGFEITAQEMAENFRKDIFDIQERVSKIENGEGLMEPKGFAAEIGSSRRILWVDDFPINNAHLIESFKEKGVEIDLSISTDDALRKISSLDYSAIISDLGRVENGIDNKFAGLELLNLIREIDKKIPVLIFAGARALGSRTKLIDAGAEDVVSSSVSVVKFVEKYAGKS